MSQPRRKASKFTRPDRFTHFNMGGRIVKPAKREPEVCLKAMERHQKWLEENREDDGDILYA